MGFWDWLMGTPSQTRELPAKQRRTKMPKKTSVLDLHVGDVVSYDEVDYVVKNKIVYSDEGFEWFDYMLHDAATDAVVWLSAEDDDGLQVGIYHEVDLDVTIPPVPRTITHEGRQYKQNEHSDAAVRVEREDATRSSQSRVEYWEYEAPGGHYLTVSRWGGDYEAAAGQAIKEYELKIFPAME